MEALAKKNVVEFGMYSALFLEESEMRHFRVLILGEHFHLNWLGRPRVMGFYVTRFVKCDSLEEAQSLAMESVWDDASLKALIVSETEDQSRLRIDSLEEISSLDIAETPPGFVFFEEHGNSKR